MAGLIEDDMGTSTSTTNVVGVLGDAWNRAVSWKDQVRDGMKKDLGEAKLVGGVSGLVGATIGFWAIQRLICDKLGLDGIGGNLVSLAGALLIGFALYNVVTNGDSDARVAHNRQQWALTHPQKDGIAPRERLGPSEAAELASGGGVKREFNGNASEIEHPYADKSVEDAIKRAHESNRGFFPNEPTKKPPAAPSDVKITVGEPGTDEAPQEIPSGDTDLVARAPAPRNGMRGPGFG